MTPSSTTRELVERLRKLVILDEVGSDNSLGREAAERLTLLEEGGGWLPIETAPRDGTKLVLYSARDEEASTGLWQTAETLDEAFRMLWPHLQGIWVRELYLSWDKTHNPYQPIHEVTHWRPLPAPPVASGMGGSSSSSPSDQPSGLAHDGES